MCPLTPAVCCHSAVTGHYVTPVKPLLHFGDGEELLQYSRHETIFRHMRHVSRSQLPPGSGPLTNEGRVCDSSSTNQRTGASLSGGRWRLAWEESGIRHQQRMLIMSDNDNSCPGVRCCLQHFLYIRISKTWNQRSEMLKNILFNFDNAKIRFLKKFR